MACVLKYRLKKCVIPINPLNTRKQRREINKKEYMPHGVQATQDKPAPLPLCPAAGDEPAGRHRRAESAGAGAPSLSLSARARAAFAACELAAEAFPPVCSAASAAWEALRRAPFLEARLLLLSLSLCIWACGRGGIGDRPEGQMSTGGVHHALSSAQE